MSPAEPTGSTKGCRSALSFQFNGDACVSVCDIYITGECVRSQRELNPWGVVCGDPKEEVAQAGLVT